MIITFRQCSIYICIYLVNLLLKYVKNVIRLQDRLGLKGFGH